MSMISIEINGIGIVRVSGFAPYPICVVAIQQQMQTWQCFRRYSSFRSLYEHLLTTKGSAVVPPVPNISEENVLNREENFEKSIASLQQWLQMLVQNMEIKNSQVFQNFLCMNANNPPNGMEIVWSSNHFPSFDEMEMDELFDRDHMCSNDKSDTGSETDLENIQINTGNRNGLMDITGESSNDLEYEIIHPATSIPRKNDFQRCNNCIDMPSKDEMASSVPVEIAFITRSPFSTSNPYLRAAESLLELSSTSTVDGGEKNLEESKSSFSKICEVTQGKVLPSYKPKVGLDNFRIIKVIGKGSFGKVFLVRDTLQGEIYAMKVLRKDNIIKRNQVEHTKTERNVLGYVRHPFIVGLNMAFQTPDKLFFVLDYCAGGELFFHLGKEGKFTEQRSKFYAAEIALALEHVHRLGIVYRDLKPENVLLDGEGHIRLTDFGLSKEGITDNTSGAHSFCGTPEYLAPEILNRKGHGRAVDWWSLGALLYEMLTGLPPFYSQEREVLFNKIRTAQLTCPRYLSEPAQKILYGLLTRNPEKRLGSSSEDASEIKRHAFFSSIDWEGMYRRELKAPWQPTVYGSVDTSQFDDEFTSMPIHSPNDRGTVHPLSFIFPELIKQSHSKVSMDALTAACRIANRTVSAEAKLIKHLKDLLM